MMDFRKIYRKLSSLRHVEIRNGHFCLYKTPMTFLSPSAFASLEKVMIENVGEEKAGKQMYMIFIEAGKEMAKMIHKNTMKTGLDLIHYVATLSSIGGWGTWDVVYANDKKLEGIYTQKDFLVSHYLKPSKKPMCHMPRGLITGVWRFAIGKNVDCIEISCVAEGYDKCTFEVGTKKSLRKKHPELVKEQIP